MTDQNVVSNVKDELLLKDVQGGILSGHGRDQAIHVFLSFSNTRIAALKKWICHTGKSQVSSAFMNLKGKQNGPFCSLLISAIGFKQLGLAGPAENVFHKGMKSRARFLADNIESDWDPVYQEFDPSGLLILADDNPVRLSQSFVKVISFLAEEKCAEVLTVETGRVLKYDGVIVEHFLYADGISQPQLLSKETEGWKITNRDLVLQDYGPEGGVGSFLVFRKLEQNVLLWNKYITRIASDKGISIDESGARIIGRYRDGRPLINKQANKPISLDIDKFDFSSDPDGNYCPLNAHIRKHNTRNGRSPRIVRRGIPYGVRPDLAVNGGYGIQAPSKGVGLLFMCYQASIERQFELLQAASVDPNYPEKGTGSDLLAISNANGRLVIPKGGEYFFAPSISFLKSI